MRGLIAAIQSRLQSTPDLAGWDVRRYQILQERQTVPAIEVSFVQAQADENDMPAVSMVPIYSVRLIHRSAEDAALDAALNVVIARLHNWHPRIVDGEFWGRITLLGVREDAYIEGGYDSYTVNFSSSTILHGCSFSDQ